MPDLDAAGVLSALGGAPPVQQQAGDVGSPEQLNSATSGDGPIQFSVGESAPSIGTVSGGRELLPKMDWAVKQQESGNRHIDADGKIVTSPKGALGISQLTPDTAKGLGVDPYDKDQNAEGGRRLLGQLYDKYGNWNDALVAYNAGEKRANEWIAGGSDPTKLPSETRDYVGKVLANLGMSPGAAFTQRKDNLSPQDVLSVLQDNRGPAPKTDDVAGTSALPDSDDDHLIRNAIVDPDTGQIQAYSKDAGDQRSSLMVGARNGLRDVFAGPAQAVLEKTAPELAKQFTQHINAMDEPYDDVTSAHPGAYFLGQTVGTTAGILAASGVLRYGAQAAATLAPVAAAASAVGEVMPLALRSLPAWTRGSAATGALLGVTAFNKDPDHASRLGEAALGAVLGPLGKGLGNSIGWMLRNAGSREQVQSFVQQSITDLKDFAPHLSKAKDSFASWYSKIVEQRNNRYAVRDSSGRLLEGYPTGLEQGGGVAKVVGDAIDGNIGRDARTATPAARQAAREVDRALGLDEQRAEQQRFQDEADAYAKANNNMPSVGGRPFGVLDPRAQAQVRQALRDQGSNLPEPPEPFVSKSITAEQMAEARRAVSRAQRRTKDPASKAQIGLLKQSLDDTAAQAARSAGVDVTTYERLQTQADKFNRDVVAPVQQIAHSLGPKEFAQKTTPAAFHDTIIRVIQGHDKDAQQAFFEALGPKAREDAAQSVLYDMVHSAAPRGNIKDLNPKAFGDYIHKHSTGIENALGTDQLIKLQGLAKIAEGLGTSFSGARRESASFSDVFARHQWFLSLAGLEAARGNLREAAGMIGSVAVLNGMSIAMRKLAVMPRAQVLLQKAAKLHASSPGFRQVMASVDVLMNAATKTTSRMVPQATGGEPVTTGLDILGGVAGSL